MIANLVRAIGAVIAIAWLIAGERSRASARSASPAGRLRSRRSSALPRNSEPVRQCPAHPVQCRHAEKEFSAQRFWNDRYLALLAIVLLGYALMGKGFAYLGFPPLYVGEIAFLAGIVVFLRIGAFGRVAGDAAGLLAGRADGLGRSRERSRSLACTGSMPCATASLSFMAALPSSSLGCCWRTRAGSTRVLRYYRIMLAGLPAMFVGFWLTKYWVDYIPRLFGPVPIVDIGASAVGTHLAGTMVFALIGFRKVSVAVGLCLVRHADACLRDQSGRDARRRHAGRLRDARARTVSLDVDHGGGRRGHLAVLFTLEATFGEYSEARNSIDRPVSAHQIVENVKSIIGQSGQQAEGTKQWRLELVGHHHQRHHPWA